jgi:hypothetical protein
MNPILNAVRDRNGNSASASLHTWCRANFIFSKRFR